MTLAEVLPVAEWVLIDRYGSRAYQDRGGRRFPTFEREGVRLAFSVHRYLAVRRDVGNTVKMTQVINFELTH